MPNFIEKTTLMTVHDNVRYFPSVVEGIKWKTEREGVPGSLEFECIGDDALTLDPGDIVYFAYGEHKVFYGFVFEVKRSGDPILKVKAYDQLRYLKNKAFYNYKEWTTAQLILAIARDYRLNCGELEDSGYPISRTEKDKTLFDIIKNSYQLTLSATKQMYVLYDDFGSLTLKNISSMAYNLLIDETTAQDYSYTRSIDKETYTQVKLTYENSESGTRDVYMAQSGESMNRWGVLTYTDTIDDPAEGPAKAKALLDLYNAETKNLEIKDAFGDCNIRAGCMLVVMLTLGDGTKLQNLMLVENCTHTWKEGEHWMDLTVRGGEFVA